MLGYKGLKNGEFEKLHRRKCKKNCSLCLAVQDDLNMSFGVFVSLESLLTSKNHLENGLKACSSQAVEKNIWNIHLKPVFSFVNSSTSVVASGLTVMGALDVRSSS